ncbi:MAG: hypothetical protein ICV78_18450 [Tolypothrix sp. Co-bin9]|nr:hypothetical protein [Tolypothrix sp. Co-bin9]
MPRSLYVRVRSNLLDDALKEAQEIFTTTGKGWDENQVKIGGSMPPILTIVETEQTHELHQPLFVFAFCNIVQLSSQTWRKIYFYTFTAKGEGIKV